MGRSDQPGDGYDAFFAECLPVVLLLGRRLTGSSFDAQDIAIEALGRAFAHWGRVRRLDYRQAWVLRVAVNLVIGQSRKTRPAPRAGRDEGIDVAETVVLREALVAALRQLPRRQREAVALRYLADLSEREAAAAMGVSTGSVKTHLSRGLNALRQALGADSWMEGRQLGLEQR
jgi:RNA polymerase sigma factor (sigma-70 family)